jgi:hypothetical protein
MLGAGLDEWMDRVWDVRGEGLINVKIFGTSPAKFGGCGLAQAPARYLSRELGTTFSQY